MTLAHEVMGTKSIKTLFQNKKGHADWIITSEEYGIVMKIPSFKGASEMLANEGVCLLKLPSGQRPGPQARNQPHQLLEQSA